MHWAPWALSTQVAPGAHKTLAQVGGSGGVLLGAVLGMLPGVDATGVDADVDGDAGVDGDVSGLTGGGAGS